MQRAINEINSGIYVFDADVLRAGSRRAGPDNDQGELYLTDVLTRRPARRARRSAAMLIDDLWQTEGVNDRVQLSPDERRDEPADPRTLDARAG